MVTLIQDAVFIYPERTGSPNNYTYEQINLGTNTAPANITGTNLSETDATNGNELHWTNSKPYVVYGFAKIPETKTLVIDPGTRVHFHANSGLIVAANAHLEVNGALSATDDLENEVIFEGDRLEPNYSEVPGQWLAVLFMGGSNQNVLKNIQNQIKQISAILKKN